MSRPATPAPFQVALALAGCATATVLTAAPAQAADSYRFWSYYQQTGSTWTFATKGPDRTTPQDGTVEGYRYAVGDMSTPRPPRARVTFDQACASVPAVTGQKRVAVVIDFGRAEDAREAGVSVPAPYATCAQVPTAATGVQVLAAAARPRVEKAMVCGVDGYPATGCSDVVTEVPAPARATDRPVAIPVRAAGSAGAAGPGSTSPSAASSSQGSGVPGWVTPAAVVVLIGAAATAWWATRRHAQR